MLVLAGVVELHLQLLLDESATCDNRF